MWQKESKHKNSLYTNLCAANGFGKESDEMYKEVRSEINVHKKVKFHYTKCNKMALKKQKSAKVYFENGEWELAILVYNESLCFAENGTKYLGISYANRSACFYNLKMYDKCLVDIELATQNNYPKHLIPALEKRKMNCLEHIVNGWKLDESRLNLNYTRDEKFPDLANTVKIEKIADKDDPTVVAKQKIDVGEIVAVDKAFCKTLFAIYGWKCNICLKSNLNLMPCQRCTVTMICRDCKDNNLHKYECGIKTSLYSNSNNYLMQELRTFFTAMDLFANVDEMMTFVEQSVNTDPLEIPTALDDNRSKYRAFLQQTAFEPDTKDKKFIQTVCCVYKILLEIPKISLMFSTKKHRRFMMHLIGHHVQVNLHQSYVFKEDFVNENGDKDHRILYSQVGVLLRYFNHRCSPNVYAIDCDGDTYYCALRPIQPGQELFISYYCFHWDLPPEWPHKFSKHNCKCERCEWRKPTTDELIQIADDPDFDIVNDSNIESEIKSIDKAKFDILMESCIRLLKKYDRILWCKQLAVVITVYAALLTANIRGLV
ncbi:uncharacterized protein LOC116344043 [Contarinia nasturtii]|uniref:uncharacterized protein LOC116344043 n=1 Tax=Contarinia nasturtii TaxID=265458 RepID=UPI0012D489A0|nr:uncharacterized protein LOC116344043 [Contarinia nasturtii]